MTPDDADLTPLALPLPTRSVYCLSVTLCQTELSVCPCQLSSKWNEWNKVEARLLSLPLFLSFRELHSNALCITLNVCLLWKIFFYYIK